MTGASRTFAGQRLFISPTEIRRGIHDTVLLLTMRWRGVRNPVTRVGVYAGAAFFSVGLLIMVNLGYIVRVMGAQGEGTAAGVFALSWIQALQRNEIGDVGAITLGGALVVAVFAPFTGSSTLTLAPVEDLHGLRLARLHRYFDSVLVNCVSGIGLLQLLALTAITSVLSLDGTRGPALLVTWAVWLSVIVLTTTLGWVLEFTLRRWGLKARWRIGAVIAAGVTIAVVLDPRNGRTVFGLGDLYSSMINSAASGTVTGAVTPLLAVLAMIAVIMWVGLIAARQALTLPAVVLRRATTRRHRAMPAQPSAMAMRLLTDTLWRTPEVRRPLLAVLAIGIPGLMIAQMSENVENAIMAAVPLAVSLAWGVNVFAVLGPGMSWLASIPGVLGRIPYAAAILQLFLVVLLVETLWLAAYVTGRATPESGLRLLTAAVVTGCLSAVFSLHLAIRRPMRARLSGRGDSLVPPLTALNYLMGLLILVCLPASLVSGAPSAVRLAAVSVSLVIFAAGTWWYGRHFARPEVRYRVVSEVSAM